MQEQHSPPSSFPAAPAYTVTGRQFTDVNELSEREYLGLFTQRPGLYIGYGSQGSVRGAVSFLNGYHFAARHHGGQGLDGFQEWLVAKNDGLGINLVWWALIEDIALPDKEFGADRTSEQEALLLAKMFELLDAFLAERESAG